MLFSICHVSIREWASLSLVKGLCSLPATGPSEYYILEQKSWPYFFLIALASVNIMGLGMGGGREVQEEGTYVYLRLIHVDVWQK